MNDKYAAEMAQWKSERIETLKTPDGYLSLVGLCWLKQGENGFGSGKDNDCQFPAGLPDKIGTYTINDSGITVSIQPDVTVLHNGQPVTQMAIKTDANAGGPTLLEIGTVNWYVIKRGDALLIRIRDSNSHMLQTFSDVERFPLEEAWRISGSYTPRTEPKPIPVPNILGQENNMMSPGTIQIEVAGEKRELVAFQTADPKRFFLVLADGLAGKETYGGGRFLTTEPMDESGNIVLDFNKATNPPCAFSPFATCPLPVDENRFSVEIPAGEKVFHY